jgi:hypothetical protein
MTGMDRAMEWVMRSPVPDSRSSGSEYPENPLNRASSSSVTPTIQLISRGRRKAPVKKIRMRWATMAAMNTLAAQWCIWRITIPARTSKLMRRTDA